VRSLTHTNACLAMALSHPAASLSLSLSLSLALSPHSFSLHRQQWFHTFCK